MKEKPEFWRGWRERLSALRNVPTVLAFVWESGRAVVIFGLLSRVAASLLPVALFWVSKLIIDTIYRILTTHESIGHRLWWLVALEFAIAVATGILGRVIDYLDALLAGKYMHHISIRVMEHAAGLDLLAYEDPVFYDRLERARVQATDRLYMIQAIGRLVQQVITTITLSISIMLFSPWLLLLLIVGVIPAFVGETHFAFLGYAKNFRQTPIRRQLDYLRILGGSKEAAKELKLFGLKDFLTARFKGLSTQVYEEDIALARRKAGMGAILSAIGTAGYYTAYVFAVWKTVTGAFTFGTLTFLANAIRDASSNLQQTFSTLSTIADQALFMTDLIAFFEMRPTIRSKANALPAPRPIHSGFEFRDVSFAYPGSERQVLNRVSFRFDAGERIALIGENGAGKTTLVKLLARLYDPTAGQILLDGVDLRDYDVDSLRKEIGVIFQDYMRYDMPVRENIGFGRIEELRNQPRIEDAARKSLAEPMIAQLASGYEQMLGRRFENGVDLSAGQWQKIALSRAFMRVRADVLVLDEPTASMDAQAEAEVFEHFRQLARGRITILISHRFSTVRMADRIAVLEQGNLVEYGSHEELMQLAGRYAHLFTLQARGYR